MLLAWLSAGSFSSAIAGKREELKYGKVNKVAAALSVALSVLLASDAAAKGKPPAEPPPEPPPGQIFYDYSYDGVSVGYAVDGDGNNPIVGIRGTPSYEFHAAATGAAHRWFLQWIDNPTQGKDIIAVRDDDVGLEYTIQLTNDPNLYIPVSTVQPVWVPSSGDSQISFFGTDLTTKQSGVFKVDVDFSSSIPEPSAPSLAWLVPTIQSGEEPYVAWEPDASRHSWSDDGTLLAFAGRSQDYAGIHVVDLVAGTDSTVAQGTRPSISPDGTAIAFVSPNFDLNIVNTDGTGERILAEGRHVSEKHTHHFAPFWSPDSDYLIWQHWIEQLRWDVREIDIWRIGRDGRNPVNLTPWVDNPSVRLGSPWLLPTGWRVDGSAASASQAVAIPEPVGCASLVLGLFALLSVRHRRGRPLRSGSLVASFLAIIIFLPTRARAELARWEVADGGNGHWYEVLIGSQSSSGTASFISWSDASLVAQARGGYLATITSAAENEFVFNLTDSPQFWSTNKSGTYYGPWLGGTQAPDAGEPDEGWYWVTGEPFEYTNWLAGEPNNWRGLDEDFLHFIGGEGAPSDRTAFWNDEGEILRNPIAYVVEYMAAPVPEPTGLLLLAVGLCPLLGVVCRSSVGNFSLRYDLTRARIR